MSILTVVDRDHRGHAIGKWIKADAILRGVKRYQDDEPLVSQGIGIREWIKTLPRTGNAGAATFDTKMRSPNLPGSAARKAEKRMHKRGYDIVVPAENFLVEGTTGPLMDGEVPRARAWGVDLTERTRQSRS